MEKTSIKERFRLLAPFLDEHMRRRFAAAEAIAIGYGGVSIVARETGLSRGAIALGCEEIKNPEAVDKQRVRRKGGGRKQAIVKDPTLKQDLERLIGPEADLDAAPLSWTCKSVRGLAAELNDMGHVISHNRIADLLHELGYTLRANQKTLTGASQDNREAQFAYLSELVKRFVLTGDPVVFVDVRKRELAPQVRLRDRQIDDSELHTHRNAEADEVAMIDAEGNPLEWLNVPIDGETAEFAATTLERWWQTLGQERFPAADRLLVVMDSGSGSDDSLRQWKQGLQHLADSAKLTITVSHLPPGTSRWHRMEHQIFSFTNHHRDARPLTSHRTAISLIMPPKLKVQLHPDHASRRAESPYHEEWNYAIGQASQAAHAAWGMLRDVANR